MSSHFKVPNDYDPNSTDFFGFSTTYEDVPNTSSNAINSYQSCSTAAQCYLTSQYADDYIQPDDSALPPQVSIPKISRTFDSSQNQILKIELEIVIKLKPPSIPSQNDQTKQKNPSTWPKNRAVNRDHPYPKPTERNFRNNNRNDVPLYNSTPVLNPALNPAPVLSVPQLNSSVDTNRTFQSQFQQNEDLNEHFDNNCD